MNRTDEGDNLDCVRAAALLFLIATAAPAQFEVASIKPSPPNETGGWVRFLPGGRFEVNNAQLIFIIQQVYEVRDFQIVDAPKWIVDWNTSRFTIEAKSSGPATEPELRQMARDLLAERFQLKIHRETRQLPVYALLPGRNGVTLKPAVPTGRPAGTGGINHAAPGILRGNNVVVPALIRALSAHIDRPVVDKTGFAGSFDFNLEWRPEPGTIRDAVVPADDPRPSLFSALQEQLGLRLNAEKDALEVIVIDHIEQPSAN